jgi:iron-sulfur cluster assembly protein
MQTNTETLITITERAEEKLVSLLDRRGFPAPLLRAFVAGMGGCSGYQYGLQLAERAEEGDLKIASGRITLIVDPDSAPLLRGAEIDFVEDVMRSGFTISNPNAPAGCDCGARSGNGPPACC